MLQTREHSFSKALIYRSIQIFQPLQSRQFTVQFTKLGQFVKVVGGSRRSERASSGVSKRAA